MCIRFPGSLMVGMLISLTLPAQTPKSMKWPSSDEAPLPLRSGGRKWTMLDLEGLLGAGLEGARHYEKGRASFRQAGCFDCHRFRKEGSASGPDLTTVANRYGPSDLLAHILDPDREIAEPYRQQEVTLKDGSVFRGRILSRTADGIAFQIDMTDPGVTRTVPRHQIKGMEISKISMMPSGLLDSLEETEILDLLAYLLSKGDREDPMFR